MSDNQIYSPGSSHQKIKPLEWLERANTSWKADISGASLLAERPISKQDLATSIRCLGSLFKVALKHKDPDMLENALMRFPVVVARTMAAIGTNHYEGGSYWPGFWRTLGMTENGIYQIELVELQAVWGRAFRRGLGELTLPTFPNLPLKNIGPILMHSGIPTYCLPDFFLLLQESMRAVGFNAEAIVQYSNVRADTKFGNIDVPVKRFISAGGEFAVDFIDRTLDLMARIAKDEDFTDIQLPEEVIERAAQYLLENRRSWRAASHDSETQNNKKFQILLNSATGQLNLSIPGIDDLSHEFDWVITSDAGSEILHPLKMMGGRNLSTQRMLWPIYRPVRRLNISMSTLELSREIQLFDGQDPIIFFDSEGLLLNRNASLPRNQVWCLIPDESTDTSDALFEFVQLVQDPPLGWSGWKLYLLNLTEVDEFRFANKGKTYFVQANASAQLELGSPLASITIEGYVVFTDRPTIILPRELTSQWNLRVFSIESSEYVVARILTRQETEVGRAGVFEGIPNPLIGRYEISLRGPLGRGLTKTIAIVEGLVLEAQDSWRLFGENGLNSHSARLISETLEINPSEISFENGDISKEACLSLNDHSISLSYTPETMAVSLIENGIPSPWAMGPIRIDNELLVNGSLFVRAPEEMKACSLQVIKEGKLLQIVAPEFTHNSGRLLFNLNRIESTLSEVRVADLFIAHQGRLIRLARVEPKKIASLISVENNRIIFNDFTGGAVLVRIWSIYEPWRDFIDVEIRPDGSLDIPSSLGGLGSLCIEWERIDPWAYSEIENFPRRGKYRLLLREIDEGRISKVGLCLSTKIADSPIIETDLERSWKILTMAERIGSQDTLPRISVSSVVRNLLTSPVDSLRALCSLKTPDIDSAKLFVRSGLIWARSASISELNDSELSKLIASRQTTGGLLSIPRLAETNSLSDYPESWAAAISIHGDSLRALIFGEEDPSSNSGSFKDMSVLESLDVEEVQRIVRNAGIVPKETLDSDSRALAALELFENRNQKNLEDLSRDGRQVLDVVWRILGPTEFSVALKLIKVRLDPKQMNGWPTLSGVSLAFATIARFTAHGMIDASDWLSENSENWMSLTRYAPKLCAIDLVLAECLVLSTKDTPRSAMAKTFLESERE